MDRRTFLTSSALAFAHQLLAASGASKSCLGICAFSCHQRLRLKAPIDAVTFFHHARELGAERVQCPLRDVEPKAIRDLVERTGTSYEGEVRLPKTEADLITFEAEVRKTREAGALVARAVFTSGRRYEAFRSLAAFHTFTENCRRTLQLVEPTLRKHRLKLALENHKDHTTDELIAHLKAISSEWIGALVDTGNNIALLEEPHGTVEALAPYAISVHLKDMAVQEAPDGFLLSEVPLGSGMLDLRRMVLALRRANPAIGVHLEMATRDPLRIPCLTDSYFATFPERKADLLQQAMERVKQHPPKVPVPTVSGKTVDRVLTEEEKNNRDSLIWMHRELRS